MLTSILSKIICDTYESDFRNKKSENIAMKIEFSLPVEHKKEEGCRWVELLIIGHGYVGVFYREFANVVDIVGINYDEGTLKEGYDYIKTEGDWQCLSCHDSCWRTDGVSKFVNMYKDKLNHIKSFNNWYREIKLSDNMIEDLRKIEREGRC